MASQWRMWCSLDMCRYEWQMLMGQTWQLGQNLIVFPDSFVQCDFLFFVSSCLVERSDMFFEVPCLARFPSLI
jgi:hypothetical protein